MTKSEINEYQQGYRRGIKWLAKQHSHSEIVRVCYQIDKHNQDLWERGYYNALNDHITKYNVLDIMH